MPSDKYNLIMAKATGLICNADLSQDVPYHQTTAAPILASWFYQSLPLLIFICITHMMASVQDLYALVMQTNKYEKKKFQTIWILEYLQETTPFHRFLTF